MVAHRTRPALSSLVRVAVGATVAGACLLSAGCGGIPPEPFVVAYRSSSAAPAATGPSGQPPTTAASLSEEFAAFAAERPGAVAVAWAPVDTPEAVQTLGSVQDEDAWSTIKVPIAIAAVSQTDGVVTGETRARVEDSIRRSHNEAATRLWRSLGSDEEAAAAVEAVLREAGDTRTQVAEDPGTARRGFGHTPWSVEDAARFAAGVSCVREAALVYESMGEIDADHAWGIGALPRSTHFKGGWGPSDHGYLMRQIGVVDLDGGAVALAVAVQPQGGSHEVGARTLDDLAAWIVERLGPADVGACPIGPPAPISPTPAQ